MVETIATASPKIKTQFVLSFNTPGLGSPPESTPVTYHYADVAIYCDSKTLFCQREEIPEYVCGKFICYQYKVPLA